MAFPAENYGHLNINYNRFTRWFDYDIWGDMHQHFVEDPDMEHVLLDSSVVRVLPCAAGALKNRGKPPKPLGAAEGRIHGHAPTGKQVMFSGISIYRLANCKVIEAWSNADKLGVMQQLGLVYPPQLGRVT